MAGVCLEKLPHSCGSSDGLQVFAGDGDTVNGFCYSCKTFVPHPYGDERLISDLPTPVKRTPEDIADEVAEVNGYPCVDIPSQKLRSETMQLFGVKTALSERDGKTVEMLCYPYTLDGTLLGYKYKVLANKRMWSTPGLSGADLFGWDHAISIGARRIIITEGEDDAIALTRVLHLHSKPDFRDFTAVVSLPTGAASAARVISEKMPKLKQFEEITLCFDMDDAGRAAVKAVCAIYSNIKSIDLPAKDAKDCVKQGFGKALFNATFRKDVPKNSRLVFGSQIAEAARIPAQFGQLSWPWGHIQRATRGIRYGETIYFGAAPKMGKGEVRNALAAHFIMEHDVPVFMASPEEVNTKTYKMMAGKITGNFFHDPDKEFDEEAFDRATAIIGNADAERLMAVDLYQHMGWDSLQQDIIEAVQAHGAKVVMIDPITNLTDGMDSGEANIELERVASDISVMAQDMQFVAFLFCHLKATNSVLSHDQREKFYREGKYIDLGNCPHGEGGTVYSTQFTGSRAMMRKCNMMIGIEGNKDDALDRRDRNTRHLKILEEREFGANGVYKLYWNHNSSLFEEI